MNSLVRHTSSPMSTEAADVLRGLRANPPRISSRYFYDEVGSRLFDRITRAPEYYPTRTELSILRERGALIGTRIERGAAIIELGSGSGDKILALFEHVRDPRLYRPIDISRSALEATCALVQDARPLLPLSPFLGDFTADAAFADLPSGTRRFVYYSGSTIGNFHPSEQVAFLRTLRGRLTAHDAVLIGMDLVKDEDILHDAYNDADGATAAFNRNILAHLNRRFGATFDPDSFAHLAFYSPEKRRIEMHLVPKSPQRVTFAGERLTFDPSRPIHTESSYKFTVDDIRKLALTSGFLLETIVTDEQGWFAEALFRA